MIVTSNNYTSSPSAAAVGSASLGDTPNSATLIAMILLAAVFSMVVTAVFIYHYFKRNSGAVCISKVCICPLPLYDHNNRLISLAGFSSRILVAGERCTLPEQLHVWIKNHPRLPNISQRVHWQVNREFSDLRCLINTIVVICLLHMRPGCSTCKCNFFTAGIQKLARSLLHI